MALDMIDLVVEAQRAAALRSGGIDQHLPLWVVRAIGQQKGEQLVMGLEQQQEGLVGKLAAARGRLVPPPAVQQQPQAVGCPVSPLLLAHLQAVRAQPLDIAVLLTRETPTLKERGAMQLRAGAAGGGQGGG